MDKKILIGVLVVLAMTMFFAPGGLPSLLFLAVICTSVFFIIRMIKKVIDDNPYKSDHHDNESYDEFENEFNSVVENTRAPVKTGAKTGNHLLTGENALTSTEQEIWELLTYDINDMLDVEDIKYENFDPPIPLKWSTLNPFKKRNH